MRAVAGVLKKRPSYGNEDQSRRYDYYRQNGEYGIKVHLGSYLHISS
jgi:hypothetical protein